MTQQATSSTAASDVTGRPSWLLTALIGLLGCALVPLWGLHPDVAWATYMAQRMLDGAVLYRDVVETNPPLVAWLMLGPVAVCRVLGIVSTSAPVILLVGAESIASLAVLSAILVRWPGTAPWKRILPPLASLVLLVFPFTEWGQREHQLAILALPSLLLLAQAQPKVRVVPVALRISAGVLAGVGLAFKPQFALAYAIAVAITSILENEPERMLAAEHWAAIAVGVCYVVSVVFVSPEYFVFARQWGALYVRSFAADAAAFVFTRPGSLTVVTCAVYLAVRRSLPDDCRRVVRAYGIAAVSFILAVILQLKSWHYHWLPVYLFASLALGLMLLPVSREVSMRRPAVVLGGLVMAWSLEGRLARSIRLSAAQHILTRELATLLEDAPAGSPILQLSSSGSMLMPPVLRLHARWGSRLVHLWMLPDVYEPACSTPLPLTPSQASARDTIAAMVAPDFHRSGPPPLIFEGVIELTDPLATDYCGGAFAFLRESPLLQREAVRYTPFRDFGRFRVWRQSEGLPAEAGQLAEPGTSR